MLQIRGKLKNEKNFSLRKKCPYSDIFCSIFSRIPTEYCT